MAQLRYTPKPDAYSPGLAPGETITVLDSEEATRLVESGLFEKVSDGTPLPEDFPAKRELEANRLRTLEAVAGKSAEDLTALKGIGQATAERIVAAVAGPAPVSEPAPPEPEKE